MRQCPFRGCGRDILDSRFACPDHWYALDTQQRDRILAAYHRYLADELTLDELRAVQRQVLDECEGVSRG